MTVPPDKLLAQLYDITGIDWIDWWPLAPGCWALLAIALILAGAIYWRRRAYRRSWKGDAWAALTALDARLVGGNAREIAASLSVLLRRIAMHCSPREECAGLVGQDWLRWLTAKDPRAFDWVSHGALLVEARYAPPGRDISQEAVKILIKAAKRWVK
jgi:Domain of unknown function (DUF4381)